MVLLETFAVGSLIGGVSAQVAQSLWKMYRHNHGTIAGQIHKEYKQQWKNLNLRKLLISNLMQRNIMIPRNCFDNKDEWPDFIVQTLMN